MYLKQGRGDGLGLRLNYEDALSVKPDLPGIDEKLLKIPMLEQIALIFLNFVHLI